MVDLTPTKTTKQIKLVLSGESAERLVEQSTGLLDQGFYVLRPLYSHWWSGFRVVLIKAYKE